MSAHQWPEYAQALPGVVAGLRSELEVWLVCNPHSMKQLARHVGVNRRTLGCWLAGDDNVTVRTLTRVAQFLRETPLAAGRRRPVTRNGYATLNMG